jgi:hypothetical protein
MNRTVKQGPEDLTVGIRSWKKERGVSGSLKGYRDPDG